MGEGIKEKKKEPAKVTGMGGAMYALSICQKERKWSFFLVGSRLSYWVSVLSFRLYCVG